MKDVFCSQVAHCAEREMLNTGERCTPQELREEPNTRWADAQAELGRLFLGIVNLLDGGIRKDTQEPGPGGPRVL